MLVSWNQSARQWLPIFVRKILKKLSGVSVDGLYSYFGEENSKCGSFRIAIQMGSLKIIIESDF